MVALGLGLLLVPKGANLGRAEANVPKERPTFLVDNPRRRVESGSAERAVIVVALDGVRPREVFQGEEPGRTRHHEPLPRSRGRVSGVPPWLHAGVGPGRAP